MPDLRLSIVVPAWNEAAFIGETVRVLRQAADDSGNSDAEIIVADDASTDATAELARAAGARVVPAGRRNIAAARNAGARESRGGVLLFVDADTRPTAAALSGVMDAVGAGVIGGGAILRWDEPVADGEHISDGEPVPWTGRLALVVWTALSRMFRLPAGGFIFMRKDAWEDIGGFPEDLFISEEIVVARRLRGLGTLVILPTPVVTSARKLRTFSAAHFLGFLFRLALRPRHTIRDRESLDIWYRR